VVYLNLLAKMSLIAGIISAGQVNQKKIEDTILPDCKP